MKDVQNIMEDWHMEKRIIIGIITAVLINMGISIWNTSFLLRALDTTPPIVERIIKLEYQISEQGRTSQAILDELKEARKERTAFRKEQSKRTTTVYDAKEHMKNRSLHN